MSIDVYVGPSTIQASTVKDMCNHQAQSYHRILKQITVFTDSTLRLKGEAYTSARTYFSSILHPLAQGCILLSNAVEIAVGKLTEEYQSQVDCSDLKQSELEEKIKEANRLLTEAENMRNQLALSDLSPALKMTQMVALSLWDGRILTMFRDRFQEQLPGT